MTAAEVTALRERLGLSKQQFADRLGVTLRLVNYWETAGANRKAPGKMAARVMAEMAAKSRKPKGGTR